jgi:hypothetical protein
MRSPKVRSLAACAALCGALAVTALAAVPSGNLLKDPGAEQGGYGDWDTSSGFVVEQYGADNRPSNAVGSSIGGGANVFAGGSEANVSSARQTVDVSSSASEIDAGSVSATLRAYLGGVDDEEDFAEVTADFFAGDDAFRGRMKIGPVTAADRSNQTALLLRSATATVPTGTRSIRLTIVATRRFGTYTDGYADNLSLTLSGPGSTTPGPGGTSTPGGTVTPPPTGTTTPGPVSPGRGRVVSIKSPGRRVKGRVSTKAPCKAGRTVVVSKGAKTLGKKKTTASGRFNIKTKKHKKGKLVVKVRRRTVGNTTCAPVKKKVPGRN